MAELQASTSNVPATDKRGNVQLAQVLLETTQMNEELHVKVDELQSRLSRSERLLHDVGVVVDAQGRLHIDDSVSPTDSEKDQERLRIIISFEERVRQAEKARDNANARRHNIELEWAKVRDWFHNMQQQQSETLSSFTRILHTGQGELQLRSTPVYHHQQQQQYPPHPQPPQPPQQQQQQQAQQQHGNSPLMSPLNVRTLPPPQRGQHPQQPQHHPPPQRSGSGHPGGIRPPPNKQPSFPSGTQPSSSVPYPARPRAGSVSAGDNNKPSGYRRTGGEYYPPPPHNNHPAPGPHPSPHQQRHPQPPPPSASGTQPHDPQRRPHRSPSLESNEIDEMILQSASITSPRNPYPPPGYNGNNNRKRPYDEYAGPPNPNEVQTPTSATPNRGGSGGYSDSGKKRRHFAGSDIDISTAGHAYQGPSSALASAGGNPATSPQTAGAMAPPSAGLGVPTATKISVTAADGRVIQAYPSSDPEGRRICRQCGMPGRYKEAKCVEKWGPGPLGPGTVCDRCRKRMRRTERRVQTDSNTPQAPPGLIQPQAQHIKEKGAISPHPHHAHTLPVTPASKDHDESRGLFRAGTLPALSFPSSSPSYQRDQRRIVSTPHTIPPGHHRQPSDEKESQGMEVDVDADAEGEEDADGEVDEGDATIDLDDEIAGTIDDSSSPSRPLGTGITQVASPLPEEIPLPGSGNAPAHPAHTELDGPIAPAVGHHEVPVEQDDHPMMDVEGEEEAVEDEFIQAVDAAEERIGKESD